MFPSQFPLIATSPYSRTSSETPFFYIQNFKSKLHGSFHFVDVFIPDNVSDIGSPYRTYRQSDITCDVYFIQHKVKTFVYEEAMSQSQTRNSKNPFSLSSLSILSYFLSKPIVTP